MTGIRLQTREMSYPCRLASLIALWLANGAYFARNLPPDSRNTLFWRADLVIALWLATCVEFNRNWSSNSRNTLFWPKRLPNSPRLRTMTRAKPDNWIRIRIRTKTGNEDKEH